MRQQSLYVTYAVLVFTSCFIQGHSLPQNRISAEEFGRKFGSGPTDNDIISNTIEEEVAVAKEEKGLMQTVVEMGIKVLPIILEVIAGSTGPSQTDRIDPIDLNGEEPFSLRNILYLGMKIFLAVAGNTADIEKSDDGNNAVIQGVMEAIIGAIVGGAEDRSEITIMAKQATEVVNLLISLVNALTTSMSQRSFY